MNSELVDVLREARGWIGRAGNDFVDSPWPDAAAAVAQLDALIDDVGVGRPDARETLAVLFAPTGPLQELSLQSGWAEPYLRLAERFDRALAPAAWRS